MDFFVRVSSLFWGFGRWLVFAVALVSSIGLAQSPATFSTGNAQAANQDETITLSSFMIDSKAEMAWVATQTLAGSRMATDFNDLATPIEVMSKDILDDLDLNNSTQALRYSTRAERREDVVTGEGFSRDFSERRNRSGCYERQIGTFQYQPYFAQRRRGW